LPSGVAAKEALKHQSPTVGLCALGRLNVESSPLVFGELSEPIGDPPEQGVKGAGSWHSVQLTVPVGGPPAELPTTVAVSPQVLPTDVAVGGTIVVMKPGGAAVTLKHSALEAVPAMLSVEPV
jgi:hypothetical protein